MALGILAIATPWIQDSVFQPVPTELRRALLASNVGLAILVATVAARGSLRTQRLALVGFLGVALLISATNNAGMVQYWPLSPNLDLVALGWLAPAAVPGVLRTFPVDRQMRATRVLALLPRDAWLAAAVVLAVTGLTTVALHKFLLGPILVALACLCAAAAYSCVCVAKRGRYVFSYVRTNKSTIEFHFDRTAGVGDRSLERLVPAQLDASHLAAMVRAGATKLIVASLHLRERPPAPHGLKRIKPERIDALTAHFHLCSMAQEVSQAQVQLDWTKSCVLRILSVLPGRRRGVARLIERVPDSPFRPFQPGVIVALKRNLDEAP